MRKLDVLIIKRFVLVVCLIVSFCLLFPNVCKASVLHWNSIDESKYEDVANGNISVEYLRAKLSQ